MKKTKNELCKRQYHRHYSRYTYSCIKSFAIFMPLKTLSWHRMAEKWHRMYTSNVMASDLTQNANTNNGNIVTFLCVTLFE